MLVTDLEIEKKILVKIAVPLHQSNMWHGTEHKICTPFTRMGPLDMHSSLLLS